MKMRFSEIKSPETYRREREALEKELEQKRLEQQRRIEQHSRNAAELEANNIIGDDDYLSEKTDFDIDYDELKADSSGFSYKLGEEGLEHDEEIDDLAWDDEISLDV